MDFDAKARQDLGLARRAQCAVGRVDYVQRANGFVCGVHG